MSTRRSSNSSWAETPRAVGMGGRHRLGALKISVPMMAWTISGLIHASIFATMYWAPWNPGEVTAPQILLAKGEAAIGVTRTLSLWPDPVENEEVDDPEIPAEVSTEDAREPDVTVPPPPTDAETPAPAEVPPPDNAIKTNDAPATKSDHPPPDQEAMPLPEIETLPEPEPAETKETPAETLPPPRKTTDQPASAEPTAATEPVIEPAPSTKPIQKIADHRAPPKSPEIVKNPTPPSKHDPPASPPAAVSGAKTRATVLNLPHPKYPIMSKRLGEEGLVLLQVEVLADGSVGQTKVLRDPGFPRLITAAIDAARKARFQPATRDGRPVRTVVRVPFRFVLK